MTEANMWDSFIEDVRQYVDSGRLDKEVKCAPEFEPPIALIDGRRVAVVFSPTWRRYHGQTNPSSPQVV